MWKFPCMFVPWFLAAVVGCGMQGSGSGPGPAPMPPSPAPSPAPVPLPNPSPSPVPGSSAAVFTGADKDGVFTLDAAGGNRKTLHLGGSPSWADNGTTIVFNYRDQVWKINPDGSGLRQVGNVPVAFLSGPQQGGNYITFTAIDRLPGDQTNMDVWLMGIDGSGPRKLVSGGVTQPSISNDGSWVCYTKQAGGHRELWRINTDGSNNKQLTFPDDTPNQPDANACAISPDGNWVAIFSGVEASDTDPNPGNWGFRNVAVIPAIGGARKVVTKCLPISTNPNPQGSCITADSPGWSPDGTRIVYDRGAPNPSQSGFWMINIDGSGDHLISATPHGAGKAPMR